MKFSLCSTLFLVLLSFLTACNKKKEKAFEYDVNAFIGHWQQKPEKLIINDNEAAQLQFMTIKPDLNVIDYALNESPYESNIPPELLSQENYFANIAENENNKLFLSQKKITTLQKQGWSAEAISVENKKANLISLSLNSDGVLIKKNQPFTGASIEESEIITYTKVDDSMLVKMKHEKLQAALNHYLERAPLLDLLIGHKFELVEAVFHQLIDGKKSESKITASDMRDEKPFMKNDKVYISVSAKTLEFKNPNNAVLINHRYSAQFYFRQATNQPMIIQFTHENEKILNNTYGVIQQTPEGLNITDTSDNQSTIWKYKRVF